MSSHAGAKHWCKGQPFPPRNSHPNCFGKWPPLRHRSLALSSLPPLASEGAGMLQNATRKAPVSGNKGSHDGPMTNRFLEIRDRLNMCPSTVSINATWSVPAPGSSSLIFGKKPTFMLGWLCKISVLGTEIIKLRKH